jgi:hypothetical protein
MDFFYVERDGKGNLVINNIYSAYNFAFAEEEKDDNLYTMIAAYEKSDAVAALQDQVQTRYEEAVQSDEKLASMVGGTIRDVMAQWRSSITTDSDTQVASSEQTTEQTTEAKEKETEESTEQASEAATEKSSEEESSQKEETTEETGKVKTKDICKVRKGPSTDAEVLGMVTAGVKLKKLGTEGDWTKVEFQGQKGYIKSSLLKNVKKKS